MLEYVLQTLTAERIRLDFSKIIVLGTDMTFLNLEMMTAGNIFSVTFLTFLRVTERISTFYIKMILLLLMATVDCFTKIE